MDQDGVEELVRLRVHRGEYRVGHRLPSERGFADELGVPQSVAHRSLQALVAEGLLSCRRGSGYVVATQRAVTKSMCVAVIAPERSGAEFEPGAPGGLLLHALGRAGMMVRMLMRPEGAEGLNAVLEEVLADEAISGALVSPSHGGPGWLPAFSQAMLTHYPLVFLHRALYPGTFSSVEANHFETGLIAARALAQAGCQRPVYLGYAAEEHNIVTQLRRDGFRAGCRDLGLSEPVGLLYESPGDFGIASALDEVMGTGESVAVFAASAGFTRTSVAWAGQRGRELGRDIGLLGMDEPGLLPGLAVPVDCIMQNRQREADMAVELLTDLVSRRGSAPNRTVMIPPYYREGGTLAKES